jgi:hypothetical protein
MATIITLRLGIYRFALLGLIIICGVVFNSCFLLDDSGEILYSKDIYTIRKKNLFSYYKASPDLFVATDKGEIKINLNAFGKINIAQEKITHIDIRQITPDSVDIYCSTNDTTVAMKEEIFHINIKKAVDSILLQQHR